MITLAEHVVAPQTLSFPEQTEVFALHSSGCPDSIRFANAECSWR